MKYVDRMKQKEEQAHTESLTPGQTQKFKNEFMRAHLNELLHVQNVIDYKNYVKSRIKETE